MEEYTHSKDEQLFIRRWKHNFETSPRDWTPQGMKRGTSSFIDWAEWLNRSDVDINIVLQILNKFEKPPSIRSVKFEYNRTGIFSKKREKIPHCDRCDSTGLRFIVRHSANERRMIANPNRQFSRMTNPAVNTCPCDCPRGKRNAGSWGFEISSDDDEIRENALNLLSRAQAVSFKYYSEAEGWMLRRQSDGIEEEDVPAAAEHSQFAASDIPANDF